MLRHPSTPPVVARWSTDDVPASHRFEYFADALSSAIVPMCVACDAPGPFTSRMTMVDLGEIAIVRQEGSAHRSFRQPRELAQSGDHTYHLIVNLASGWTMTHCGQSRLAPGDAVLADSDFAHDLEMPSAYKVVHVKLSEHWMRQWVSAPAPLVGRCISARSRWGRAMSAFVSALSPQSVVESPLHPRVHLDQMGAMLALVAGEMSGKPQRPDHLHTAMRRRIQDCLAQRCSEPGLCGNDVATALNVPETLVHQALGAFGLTFHELLTSIRLGVAIRMLGSRSFRAVPIADVARRVGFADGATLTRAMRACHGVTASEIRREAPTVPR